MNKIIFLLVSILSFTSIQAQTFFDNLTSQDDIEVAIGLLGSEKGTLYFCKGPCLISEDEFPFPENVTLEFTEGSYLTALSPINVIINGAGVKAGNYLIFDENIKFDLQFSSYFVDKSKYNKPKVSQVVPQWFGQNNSISVNKAMKFAFLSSRVVHIPSGTYPTNGIGILLQPHVSVFGDGNTTILKKGDFNGPIVSYDETTKDGYNFNIRLENFCIKGDSTTVTKSNVTNVSGITNDAIDGLVLNPYWGLDGCMIESITITDCGGWGLKIIPSVYNTESDPETGLPKASAMVMQHCAFTNVDIRSCGNGVKTSGFIAQTQFNSCEFEWLFDAENFGTGFETINKDGRGPQDLTFINCTFHKCREGFHSYASRNIVFLGCHFEGCSKYAFYSSSKNNETPIGFYNSSFSSAVECDYPIYIEENSNVNLSIYNNVFKGGNSSFVKMPSHHSNGILVGANNKAITIPGNGYIENAHNVQGLNPFETGQIHLNTPIYGGLGIDINRFGKKVAFLGSETTAHEMKGLLELYHDPDLNNTSGIPKVKLAADGDSYINSGKLGIGTNNPLDHLHLNIPAGQGGGIYISSDDPTPKPLVILGDAGSGSEYGRLYLYNNDGVNDISLRSGTSSYFNGGNIGIGETAPSSKLHVKDGDVEIENGTLKIFGKSVYVEDGYLKIHQ